MCVAWRYLFVNARTEEFVPPRTEQAPSPLERSGNAVAQAHRFFLILKADSSDSEREENDGVTKSSVMYRNWHTQFYEGFMPTLNENFVNFAHISERSVEVLPVL